jgi:integrase
MEHQTLIYDHDMRKLFEVFSKDDILRMLDAIDKKQMWGNTYGEWMRSRNKCILMMMYHLAARPKEICSIRVSDFDIEHSMLKIRAENNKVKRDRVLPIPSQVIPYLQSYLSYPRHLWKGSNYLFPSMERSHISSERWKHIMREDILKPAGLWLPPQGKSMRSVPRSSYTLRHTKLSEIMNKTGDIYLVANIAGNTKLDSSKPYLHKSKKYMDKMREALSI